MPQTDHDRVIALAGAMQAADLVRGIARHGQVNPDDAETCLASLIRIDASSSAEVYGSVDRLRPGLRLLEQQFNNPRDMELTRYVVTLLRLERQLSKREDLLRLIRAGIEDLIGNLAHFPVAHSNTIARFADIYLKTLSTLSPRIMVNGDPVHLNNPENPGAAAGRRPRGDPVAAKRRRPADPAAAAQRPAARSPPAVGEHGLNRRFRPFGTPPPRCATG